MLKLLAASLIAALTIPASADDIIALERAALDRSDKGDPQGFIELSAPDVVYQDPFLAEPLNGIEALKTYYKQFEVENPSPGVMKNITLQHYGEISLLSFHYTAQAASPHPVEWNTTEVYRKTKEGWRIVHTHWALAKSQPAN